MYVYDTLFAIQSSTKVACESSILSSTPQPPSCTVSNSRLLFLAVVSLISTPSSHIPSSAVNCWRTVIFQSEFHIWPGWIVQSDDWTSQKERLTTVQNASTVPKVSLFILVLIHTYLAVVHRDNNRVPLACCTCQLIPPYNSLSCHRVPPQT